MIFDERGVPTITAKIDFVPKNLFLYFLAATYIEINFRIRMFFFEFSYCRLQNPCAWNFTSSYRHTSFFHAFRQGQILVNFIDDIKNLTP